MTKKLIVANWKLNPTTLKDAQKLAASISVKAKNKVVLCPPTIYLSQINYPNLGAQDCFWQEKGAFTGQVYAKLSDPPLNFYIHNMPIDRGQKHSSHEEKSYHWHLTIFPRITIWAGFEFATGIPLNPMPPEVTARFLRGE